jgi:hypothetical protein
LFFRECLERIPPPPKKREEKNVVLQSIFRVKKNTTPQKKIRKIKIKPPKNPTVTAIRFTYA